jgi:hypothetical protein
MACSTSRNSRRARSFVHLRMRPAHLATRNGWGRRDASIEVPKDGRLALAVVGRPDEPIQRARTAAAS